ncbi:biotin carboxylase N-terminal domain-containing protein [Orientia tsutsugamushi]|uniref:biotin carboxylase N-terminal domain-containing protein n=1 Tax=Orientia tsutsugamushi TaxID=784 RepID=UPI001CC24FA0|nr:biotin carboxylase N-terminal domain-containing protein [Orientia tsutsugamushi]
MGIKSAAVYSEADTNALHVQYADKACFIGNSPVPESYISISYPKSKLSAYAPNHILLKLLELAELKLYFQIMCFYLKILNLL